MSLWDLGEVFSWYDRDSDGLVDNENLLDMLRSLGMCIAYGDVAELKQHYPLNGVCTFIEFQRLAKMVATRQKSFDAEKELKEAFDFLNDGGRHVELDTVRHLLLVVGENITDDEFVVLCRLAKVTYTGGTQVVDWPRFKQLFLMMV